MAEKKRFRCPTTVRLFIIVASGLILLSMAYPCLLLVLATMYGGSTSTSVLTIVTLVWIFFLSGLVMLITANYMVEVHTDPAGLSIVLLGWQQRILWADIIDIKPSVFNFPWLPLVWVVKIKRGAAFYRLNGLFYALSPTPSFVIYSVMESCQELVQRIELHAERNRTR